MRLKHLILAAVMAGALVASAVAGPLNLQQVAGDAQWVGHVDFDAIRESTVVKRVLEKHIPHHKNAERLMKMCEELELIGMSPKKDLHGLTIYGMKIGKHKGVGIWHAKVDRAKVEALANNMPGHQNIDYGDHKIWSWTNRRGDRTPAASWYGTEHVVMASSADELKAALDVLDGKSASVGSGSALAGPIPAGAAVLLRATGIKDCEHAKKGPIARQTESFRLVLGEKDGQSFFRCRSTMINTEIVGDMANVVKGVQAVMRIHCHDNEQGLRIANGLKIKPEGNTLTLLWSASADDVWEQLDIHAATIGKKIAEMRQHFGWHGAKSKCKWCGDNCPGDECPLKDKDKPQEKPATEDEI